MVTFMIDDIDKVMEELNWHKEVHTIHRKKYIRYHKGGFELPIEYVKEFIERNGK